MELPQDLLDLAEAQSCVVTRRQLGGVGLTSDVVRPRLGRSWRLLLPGVVLLEPGVPTTRQRLVAALLLAGPTSWLAGPTAATVHGLPGATSLETAQRIHVLVPAPRRPRDVSWVSIRRTHLTDERLVEPNGLRTSCKARAVVDAAAAAPDVDGARVLIIAAIQQRLVRTEDVAHWIEARQPNGRLRLRRAFDEAMSGVWSLPEADLLRILSTSRLLPAVMANPELHDDLGRRLTTPDLWIDDVGLAVMVHSRQFHGADLEWERTVECDADLSAARVVVVGVTPASIARDPRSVRRRVELAYQEAKRAGVRAPVTATPRRTLVSRVS